MAGAAAVYFSDKGPIDTAADAADATSEQIQQLINWSGTHQVTAMYICVYVYMSTYIYTHIYSLSAG